MSPNGKVLCTFPGKFGDILWSLATVQHISKLHGHSVHMGIMPQYLSLLSLIVAQPYIAETFVIHDWECTGSPHGDQPWQHPVRVDKGYEYVHPLGYRGHPSRVLGGPDQQLIDFIASQQGMKLENPIPFLYSSGEPYPDYAGQFVTYSFNMSYIDTKNAFLNKVIMLFQRKHTVELLPFVNVGTMPWMVALDVIDKSSIFIGCRSSNWVIAEGLGKPTLTFEPHPERNITGGMGQVFGNSYGNERAIGLSLMHDLDQAAELGYITVLEALQKENKYADVKTISR